MHEEWTHQLSAYLDDELPAAERETLEAHLSTCVSCRAVLDELRAVVAWAPTYVGQQPERDHWSGISAEIERKRVVAFPARLAQRFSLAQLAAAAAVVAVLSGGGVWIAMRSGGEAPVVAAVPTTPDAGTPVFQTAVFDDPEYDEAVSDLEAILREGRAVLDSSTVRIIEENLKVIDDAIAEARAAIEADPSNVHLGVRVKTHMQRKLVLLRQAAWAVGAST
ncbi:MAG: anti-sigma factor [Gemmatimonadales bacterium]